VDVDVVEVASGVFQARAKHVGWVLVVEGDEVTLVDSGWRGDRDRVIASLSRVGRSPADVAAVVLTHAHPDHLGSAEYFRTVVGKPVLAHELEVPNATGAGIEQAAVPSLLKMAWRPDAVVWAWDSVIRLKGLGVARLGDVQTFGSGPLEVPGRPIPLHTPGHTSGHCVFHLPERGVLLAGDALMTDHALDHPASPELLPEFFNHDHAQARASLALIADLEADVVVPGHGPVFRGTPAQAVASAIAAVGGPQAPGATRLRYGAVVPLPLEQAFAFVSGPRNWPLFFDGMRSAEAGADWGAVGGHARMTTAMLGRAVESELELTVWDPPREFRYLARQPGHPEADNRRVFVALPGGTRLVGTTDYRPRGGVSGLIDQAFGLALQRTYREAMTKLPQVANGHSDREST
jgi:glyoxylase-like metal-dependent hydrolase (beta-lactamase superfamily II)